MSPKYYLVKDPMREVKDFRSQMAMYSVLCFIIIALIWNIIMRWSKIIEIVVFLVCQALIIASSITMVLSNVSVTTASRVLVVLTAAHILVVFSNFVGIMGLIGPKLSARINGG